MKRDNLENFITQHRAEMDTAHPPLHLWAAIERRLDENSTTAAAPAPEKVVRLRLLSKLRLAAGIAALLVTGFVAGLYIANQPANAMTYIERVNPDFRDAEQYYNAQIQDKLHQLAAYQSENQAVTEDLAQVDAIMAELRRELASAPAGAEEQIVAELIRSYRTKVAILEKVLDSIHAHHTNQSKTQQNETGI